MQITELILELFINREDVYAEGYLNGSRAGYAKKTSPITKELILQHLRGETTIGVYQLKNNKVKWGCLDFDENTPEDFEKAKTIYNFLKEKGYHPLMENSGGGEYKSHIWIFAITTAYTMRRFLEQACELANVKPHEIFPKQTEVKENDYGNLVKLPLATHPATKKKSFLYDDNFNEEKNVEERLNKYLLMDSIEEIEEEKPKINLNGNNNTNDCQFLNYCLTHKLPQGKRHEIISRNMAIYIHNRIDRETLKKTYIIIQEGSEKELDNWIKGIEQGKNAPFSCGELINYQKDFKIPLKCKGCLKLDEYKQEQKSIKRTDKIISIETKTKNEKTKEVLTKLALDEKTKATELMVKDILTSNHIYTTRDDEKSEMWIYNKGIYLPQGRTFLKEYCRNILEDAYTTHLANQVIAKIEADTYINQKDFFNNEHPDEIAVENGILNVINKSLRPFNHNDIFFNKIPIKYTPLASCEAIISHLKAVLKYEEDLPVIQELFGYLLYKQYNIEKAFMFIGNGRNGKGKTLDIMKRFIGPENCSNISLEQIENESFAMGELFHKMANLAGDISKTSLRSTGKFKGLTGRDMMSAPRKFLPMVHFVNYAKMIFCANDLPITYDTTPAFWNRWLLVEFPYTFISQKEYDSLKLTEPNGYKIADPDIVEKVTSPVEMQGLLCWALEGLDRLLKQGDFSYSKNMAEVQDLWMRKSSSFNAFIKDNLIYDYDGIVSKEEIRKVYAQYCKKYNLRPVNDKIIKNTLNAEFGAYDDRYQQDKQQIPIWTGVKFSKGSKDSRGFSTYSKILDLHIDKEMPTILTTLTFPQEIKVDG